MTSIKQLKIEIEKQLEGTHLWHMLTGHLDKLKEVVEMNNKIKADLLYSGLLNEKECKIIEKYNEKLNKEIEG